MLIFPRAAPRRRRRRIRLTPRPRPRIWHSWQGAERYSLAPTLFSAPGTRAYFEGHSKERQERGGGGGPRRDRGDTRMQGGREATLMCVSLEEACMREGSPRGVGTEERRERGYVRPGPGGLVGREGKFLRLFRFPPLNLPVCRRASTTLALAALPPIWPGALNGQRAEGGMCTGKEQDVRTAALRGRMATSFWRLLRWPWKEKLLTQICALTERKCNCTCTYKCQIKPLVPFYKWR